MLLLFAAVPARADDPGPVDVLAADPAGESVWMVHWDSRVRHLSAGGEVLFEWHRRGYKPGEIFAAAGLAVAPWGDVYVMDAAYGSMLDAPGPRIERFTAQGGYLGEWKIPFGNWGPIAIGPDHTLHVPYDDRIVRYSPTGEPRGEIPVEGFDNGDSASGTGIAVDSAGRVYLAANSLLRVLAADGTVLAQWSVSNPRDLADDHRGGVFVLHGDRSVSRFDATGRLLGRQAGLSDDSFRFALAVAGSTLFHSGATLETMRLAPTAQLVAAPQSAPAGDPVTLDATGSTAPFGDIERFEWDLDGDGVFETDTGRTGSTVARFASAGRVVVSVRASAAFGGATQSATLDVTPPRAAPPAGTADPSVTINGGARFTNDPHVTLTVTAPAWAQRLRIATDGGFVGAREFPVAREIRYTLPVHGSQLAPRTVYVSFGEGLAVRDDIVLDTVRPRVRSVTRGARRLRIRARDGNSGLARMQVRARGRAPGAWVRFRPKIVFTGGAGVRVRVADRAGNVSRWSRPAR